MNAWYRTIRLVLLVSMVATSIHAGEVSKRARIFGALPNWTGLWETEQAAALIESGTLQRPKLWDRPPYNIEWQNKVGNTESDPAAAARPTDLPPSTKVCEPAGFPAVMEFPVPDLPLEVLATPEQVLIVAADGTVRHVYTDGRPHPNGRDLWPTAEGHSIGHWERETLVVDTIARKSGPVGPLPDAANLSDAAHFVERIRRLDSDTLENEMTIDDAERFANPWRIVIRYRHVTDVDRMIPANCRENDRNPLVDGRFVIAPP